MGGPAAAPSRTPRPARYSQLHSRFLRLADGEAEAALEGAMAMVLRPGLRVLDAGCGPGNIAPRLVAREAGIDLTLVDVDTRMLGQCRDIVGRCLPGTREDLPLRDGSVDVTLAFWPLEPSPIRQPACANCSA